MPRRLFFAYCGIGVVVSLHWLTFYGAIKLANASVAATCIALAPVFLAVVEPYVAGRRFAARELLPRVQQVQFRITKKC
jgi:drug/metabolite transporter (DMT)-like permease